MLKRFTHTLQYLSLLVFTSMLSNYVYASNDKDNPRTEKDKPNKGIGVPVVPVATAVSMEAQLRLDEALRLNYQDDKLVQKIIVKDNLESIQLNVSSAAEDGRTEARAAFGYLDALGGAYKDAESISYEDLQDLPVGLTKKFGNTQAEIAITKVNFYSSYAEMTLYVRLTMDQKTTAGGVPKKKELIFGADKIKFTKENGFTDFTAVLLGDFVVDMGKWSVVFKGNFDKSTGNIAYEDACFVSIKCGAYNDGQLAAEVIFPRDVLEPLAAATKYKVIPDQSIKVRAGLKTRIGAGGLQDILAQVSFSHPFSVAGYDKVGFILSQATLDMSDTHNPDHIGVIINSPDHPDLQTDKTWQGVVIKQFGLLLPSEIKDKRVTTRKVIEVNDFVFSRTKGVSGTIAWNYATNGNAISIGNGDASKWAFSVANFEVTFVDNKLTAGNFSGIMKMPLAPDNPLGYTCKFNQAGFTGYLNVTQTNLKFKAWHAQANLTSLGLEIKSGPASSTDPEQVLKPVVTMAGSLSVSTNKSGQDQTASTDPNKKTIGFKVGFDELRIFTDAPYISVKGVSGGAIPATTPTPPTTPPTPPAPDLCGTTNKGNTGNAARNTQESFKASNDPNSSSFLGFPITMKEAYLETTADNKSNFVFGIEVAIMGNGVKAAAGGAFEMEYNLDNGAEFRLVNFKLRSIKVQGKFPEEDPKLEFCGEIEVYETATAKGFKGNLNLKTMGVGVYACAEFGYDKAVDFHYWNIRAKASFPAIPFAGPLAMNGLAGGAYYHMKQVQSSLPRQPCDVGGGGNVDYVADNTVGLGFRAALGFEAGGKFAFTGFAGFEMEFSTAGAINKVGIFGEGTLAGGFKVPGLEALTKITSKLETVVKKAQATLPVVGNFTTLDLINKATGQYEEAAAPPARNTESKGAVYARVGLMFDFQNKFFQGDVVADLNAGILTGSAKINMYFSESKWYVHVGKSAPADRVKMGINLGIAKVEANAYFMVGDEIPDLPCPDQLVLDILRKTCGASDREMCAADKNQMKLGKGIAFGTQVKFDFEANFFIYASLHATLGLDVLMKDYNDRSYCGRNVNESLGFGRWYLLGQVYAGFKVEVGVDLLFDKIELASGSAAALMRVGAPNPTWFQGSVAVEAKMLGVLKGRLAFDVELGDVCGEFNGTGKCATQ